jgi:murein DD-endopeptidase MepM/ murein hydrolase activator NlpD
MKWREILRVQFGKASDDLLRFFQDVTQYIQDKLVSFGKWFETYKDSLVSILMTKRGRYHGSFLNLSLFVLVMSGIIAAPHISSYYPTLGAGEVLSSVAPPSATVADLNTEGMSMATEESTKPRDQILDYTIQSGDTLSSISQKFDVSPDTVSWSNNLQGKNPIVKPGQVLKIPPVTGVVHKVKRGDTVYSIAKKYDVDPQLILNYPFNDFVDLDTFALAVGQNLIVPEGVMPEAATGNPSITRPPAPQYLAREGVGKLLFPSTGSITQNPVWYHMALDIANRAAPDIYAAESGTIVLATCLKWGYGCHIIIDHGNGMQTLYGHMSQFYVTGGTVSRGQAIGRMGSTGRSTGMHLHFEVRIGGKTQNPWNYLK